MPQVERRAAMSNVEAAHLALNATRVAATAAAAAATARDLGEHRVALRR